MYKSSKSCVSYKNKTSEFFASRTGVRQGENLSPLLFAIFLNDLEKYLMNKGCKSLSFIEKLDNSARGGDLEDLLKLIVILYADDTVIMAESEEELQHQLNSLYDYCICNKLEVNTSKTKVMVFTKSKVRLRRIKEFKFGESVLERVEEYTYLGIVFNWNGSFAKAKKALHDKAMRAMYSIVQKGRKLSLPINVMLKLFDSCVLPILLYGSEIWGHENSDLLERVHAKFCKLMIKVSKYTHNTAVYGELGRYPLSFNIELRIVNYWCKILSSKGSKLNCIMYNIMYQLWSNGKYESPWLKSVKNILQNCGLNFIWVEQAFPSKEWVSQKVKSTTSDQLLQNWREKVNSEIIFSNYRIYKDTIGYENYLDFLPQHLKYAMAEFRTGSSKLSVNSRTNSDLPRHAKTCNKCHNNGKLGDEFHFLFECSILEELRRNILPKYFRSNINTLKMYELLNSGKVATFKLARFIYLGFKIYCNLPNIG